MLTAKEAAEITKKAQVRNKKRACEIARKCLPHIMKEVEAACHDGILYSKEVCTDGFPVEYVDLPSSTRTEVDEKVRAILTKEYGFDVDVWTSFDGRTILSISW